MPTNPDSPLCPDWVFLNNCNVHVAKDRGWFKTYTPFKSIINPSPYTSSSSNCSVLGIGTVEIPTKCSPNLSGKPSHASLHLKEVLHVPEILCNIIGQPIVSLDGYSPVLSFGKKSNGTIKDSQGKNVAYFDPDSPLFAVKVRGPPTGPKLGLHVLQEGGMYMISCHWRAAERKKWEEFKTKNGLASSVPEPVGTTCHGSSYTDEEKAYIKLNWRSEFHFLSQHGLNIHKEEDRAEGRQILRTLMTEDGSDEESDEESDKEPNKEPEEELEDDASFDFEGHQADYNFSRRQLEWIEKHYRNSENFMICFGLKFYDEDDLEEARIIADAMMDDK